ncbi:Metallo-dependent hydrolase [Imleria badia]|nr:Metallo-dependent hydrolase [Imleria badia]
MINLYYGPVINPKTLLNYLALPRCLIAVGSDGNIIWIEDDIEASAIHSAIALRGLEEDEYKLVDFSAKPGEFIIPGLIDTHVHACQFPNLGIGGDLQLLDWLFEYVFPTESKFENNAYAERAYNSVIDRSIASGTTTSCYYGSLHLDATKILADIIHKKGQRAFVGKCNMDWNCPGYYIEKTPEASLEDTIKLIEHIQALPLSHANEPLVQPIITPRFALSCSNKLLTKLGELAKSMPHIAIQTHISENRREVEDAMRRFGTDSYAAIYDEFGLLRNNTVLGHGVWLTEKEMKLIAARGAGVAHCPTSNFYLSSGMARVGMLLDHGVKVGLGTDVGGGYNPSILYTIQMASTASKMVAVQTELDEERRQRRLAHKHCRRGKHGHGRHAHGRHGKEGRFDVAFDGEEEEEEEEEEPVPPPGPEPDHHHHHHAPPAHCHAPFANKKLETATLLYLATLGGANVCCLQDRIGSFEVGKAFDALYVSMDDAWGNPAVWGPMNEAEKAKEVTKEEEKEKERKDEEEKLRRWLERFLFCGDNRNVRRVWVQGLVVGGADGTRAGGDPDENEG